MSRCSICYRRLAPNAVCPHDGGRADERLALAEPAGSPPRIEGWLLHELLGQGGFAQVWRAVREVNIRDGASGAEDASAASAASAADAAIKVARSAAGTVSERFAREADALAAIGPPWVPALIDRGELADGRAYLVIERLHGRTLADELAAAALPLPMSEVRTLADAVLAGLEVVHDRGFIHRDVNPSNLLFRAPGPGAAAGSLASDAAEHDTAAGERQLALIDFGIARSAGTIGELTVEGAMLGTPEYTAPEQFRDATRVDIRADLYSFGVLLYELLTLRVPFVGDRATVEHGHLALRPPRPNAFADVPEPWEQLCLACLAKQPDRRPATVDALRCAIAALPLSSPGHSSGPRGGGPSPEHGPRATRDPQLGATPSRGHTPPQLEATHQPVVLLVVQLRAGGAGGDDDGDRLEAAVARCGGAIVRNLPRRRRLCAFLGTRAADPGAAAAAVAREMFETCQARAALHLAHLRVRPDPRSDRTRVYGAAVSEPDGWLPDAPWAGLFVTPEGARALPVEPDVPPLVGRSALVELIAHGFLTTIEEEAPGLVTVLGERGLGKSRLARELEGTLRAVRTEARVIRVSAERHRLGPGDQALRQLFAASAMVGIGPGAPPRHDAAIALGEALRAASAAGPVALIVDDAHLADERALDALEYATLDARGVPLLVVALANPRLVRARVHWGERAHRHVRTALKPLTEDDAEALARAFLQRVEYPPASALRRLARWTGGNPQLLEQLVRTLEREGIVRARRDGDGYALDTGALATLPSSPAIEWLAARELQTLTPELAACARVCAVLGTTFGVDELEWVQDAAERAGTASSSADARFALDELERRGIVVRGSSDLWSFRYPGYQDALHASLPLDVRNQLHDHALAYWLDPSARARRDGARPVSAPGDGAPRGEPTLAAIARHAAAVGDHAQAADAQLALGDRARRDHRHVDADAHYTAALGLVADDPARRVRALAGRGGVRYRIQRGDEAIADLHAARAASESIGDEWMTAHVLLEEATALDWAYRLGASDALIARARELADRLGDPALAVRCLLAEGRAHYRAERNAQAVPLLADAAARAEMLGDQETQAIALVLLAPALVMIDRIPDAKRRFDEVITLCEHTGDKLHLCSAYVNRLFLWSALPASASAPAGATAASLDRATEDLRNAVKLARELGQPALERIVTHNLSESLYWSGDDDEALPLARRARILQQRFLPEAGLHDALLVARIQASRGDWDEVRSLLDWIARSCPPADDAPVERLLVRALALALAERAARAGPERAEPDAAARTEPAVSARTDPASVTDPARAPDELRASWRALLSEARTVAPGEECVEMLYLCARAAIVGERLDDARQALAEAAARLDEVAIWRARVTALQARCELR